MTDDADLTAAPSMSVASALLSILSYVRPYRARALIVLLSLTVDVLLNIFLSLSLKLLIDYALGPGDRRILMALVAALVLSFIAISIAQLGRDYLYSWLGARMLADLRKDMFLHLQRLSVGFFAQTKLGDLLARFSTDLAAVENAILLAIPQALFAILNVALGTVVLILLEWRLAIVILLGMPACLTIPRIFGRKALATGADVRLQQALLIDTIQENLSAQQLVKVLNLQEVNNRTIDNQLNTLARLTSQFTFLSNVTERSPNIVMLGFNVLVIAGGGLMVFGGMLSIGSLVAFNLLFVSVSAYVESLSAAVPSLLSAVSGMRRIREVLDERPAIVEPPDAVVLPRVGVGISFRDVSFGYLSGERNLDDVSFEIAQGEKIALVGSSGSGKSTCIQLILRFYDPNRGEVQINGIDLRRVKLSSLYDQVGVVFQDTFLFNSSIRENIRIAKPDASDAEVEDAARAAELDPSIRAMPRQFDTIVGGQNARVSGGERQRLGIARALISERPIIILDEATSALDPVTAAAINDTLARATVGRTVIAITHRLQEVVGYDRIFVMDRGKLVETGTHDELLRREGAYAALWRRQSALTLSADGVTGGISVDSLAEMPLFRLLDRARLDEIVGQFTTEHVPADRAVIVQGDEGSRFYIIVRGKVAVTVEDAAGARHRMAVLVDGDYFGEMSLMARAPTNATVETLVPSILLSLQRDQFNRLIRGEAKLSAELDRTYRERLEARSRTAASALSGPELPVHLDI